MNKQEYDNQALTAYLLGSLPEAEVENFDELSFTDDDFAVALSSAEKDLIDAYIQGELTGPAFEKFKSHYLASPLRRQKVEFAGAFQVFAEKNIDQKREASFGDQRSEQKQKASAVFSAINAIRLLQWGFAAAALFLLVLGGWWFFGNRSGQPVNETVREVTPSRRPEQDLPNPSEEQRPPVNSNKEIEIAETNPENTTTQQNSRRETPKENPVVESKQTPKKELPPTTQPKITIATFILAPPLRGSNQVPNFPIPAQTNFVAMQLQLESDDYSAYQVSLVSQDNKNLWRSRTIKIKSKGENKVLKVQFPASLLKSHTYSLEVSGINPDGSVDIISNYPFRAVLK